jgi:hypothetical protein
LAKTMGRAGYPDAAERLFAEAGARARSESGSWALVAHVHREHARRSAEQGQWVRAKVETLKALRAARASGAASTRDSQQPA